MALRFFVVRRAAASLILVAGRCLSGSSLTLSPLANRSPSPSSSSSVFRLSASRLLPFSTNAPSLETSIESPNQKQTACGLSEDWSPLDPFDYIEVDRKRRVMTLGRKTKDEIIEILVQEGYFSEETFVEDQIIPKRACIWVYVKILYGTDFKKCMAFGIRAFPDDPGQIVIQNVKISIVNAEDIGEVHVDEFEGFLERRGFNRSHLDFMIKYAEERRANLELKW